MPRPFIILLAALALCLPTSAYTAHPVIPGFERFYTNANADTAKGGQLLLAELNCVACHIPKDASLGRKQAPILDAVGSRVKIGFLRQFIADPQKAKPGTTMPDLFANDPERQINVEALVHFLASTGGLKQERPDAKGIATGRKLYADVGCIACHGTRDAAAKPEKVTTATVPLPDLKTKYSISSLAAFLADPQHARPAGRMPRLLKDIKEARDVANYLLQGLQVDLLTGPGSTKYAYYEGSWDQLPDFAKLKPKSTGQGAAFDLSVARREGDYAIKFDGYFLAGRTGSYRFSLNSDDGSKLYVDGKQVVDNDGIHAMQAKSGKVELTKGVHQVTVTFLQGGGGAELEVYVDVPGVGVQNFAPMIASTEAGLTAKPAPIKKDNPDALDIQPALVAKGKDLFISVGCANCHQMKVDNKLLVSTLKAPKLDDLTKTTGCIDHDSKTSKQKNLPDYHLDRTQHDALKGVLGKPLVAATDPKEILAHTMLTFNCYACHQRDKVGGPEEALNKYFLTTQPEMGDEARVPPPLDNAGAKLNPDYLKQILDRGANDRPYMRTRMPGFGSANVGHLVAALGSLDKFPAVAAVDFPDALPKVKAIARHMVGDNALGCVKCHTFNGQKAEGVQGIDMTLMTRRLQRDWFHAYLIDPQKVRPGTRMPTAWPEGKSVLPDLLGGKTDVQVEAIWAYLKDGGIAQAPIGSRPKYIPLVPEKGAIIYRNFIQGSGPRAIGVGYPEKANLTFDANELRLSMLWQGAFIDAARHWTDRGVGFEPPLGDNVLHLPNGPTFALLTSPSQPWPTKADKDMGYQFKGYHLTRDDRPTFMYTLGEVQIEDFPNAVKGKDPSLKRELTLSGSPGIDNLYCRPAAGKKIEPAPDGWFKIDGWKLKLTADAKPEIRESGGKAELIVPVRLKDGKGRIVLEYVW